MNINKKIIFYDGFKIRSDRWKEDAFSFHYKGSYHLYPRSFSNDFNWVSLHKSNAFKNFIYEVETEWVGGLSNVGYGLAFRSSSQSETYVFTITKNGFYSLGFLSNGDYHILTDWKETSLLNKEESNLIGVACVGSDINAYINGNHVACVHDTRYSKGCFGFFSGANVHSCFNKVKVSEIDRNDFFAV